MSEPVHPVSEPGGSRGRVVIVANTSWYVHNFRTNLISELLPTHEVIVAAAEDEYSQRLKALGCEFRPVHFFQGGVRIQDDLKTLWQLFWLVRKVRPRFVLNFTPKANIFASLACAGADVVVLNNISGLGRAFSSEELAWVKRVSIWLYRLASGVVGHTFYQNSHDLVFGVQQGFSPPSRSSRIPGSGVDLSRFSPAIAEKRKGLPVHFMHISRLLPSKGVFDFLEAATRLREEFGDAAARFTVVGPSSSLGDRELRRLDELIRVSRADYLGMVDRVEDVLRDVHCVVLPSSYGEGVPRSLLEAAARGKLLLCYPNPGCEEITRPGETGFVTTESTIEALEKEMARVMMLPPDEYKRICRQAAAVAVAEFDERIVIDQYRVHMNRLARPRVGEVHFNGST